VRWLEAAIAGLLAGFPLALLAVAIGLGARGGGDRALRRPRSVELSIGAWGMAAAIVAHGLRDTTGLGALANGVAVVPAAFGGAYLLHLVVVGRSAIVGDPVRAVVASVLVLVGAAALFEVGRGLEPVGGIAGERVIELWEGPRVVVEQIIAAAVALAGVAVTAVVVSSTRLALRARAARSSEELLAQGGHDPRAVAASMAAVAAAVGALAGIALSRGQPLAPPDALDLTVLGAEAAVIGGVGSIPGALGGGLVLGLLRLLGDEASAGWGPVMGHVLALGVLALRAAGASLAQPRLEGPVA
jgi:branched-subunit amino acid ABC-type transport system permease component